MNPQLTTRTAHLNDAELTDLLLGDSVAPAAEAHLAACPACAAELAGLRDSLAFFQQATLAHSEREFDRVQRTAPAARPMRAMVFARATVPALGWLAAAALLAAAVLPIEGRLPPAPRPAVARGPAHRPAAHQAESDEALLEDINRDLSASVPEPMQALADPTGQAARSSQ